MNPTRRDVIAGTTALEVAAGLTPWSDAMADEPKLEMKPLPFDRKRLAGLSERLLTSHWENNYGGAVKNLVKTREQLATITKDTPGFVVGGLMERELTFRNSVVLHELYFGGLGGDGQADGGVATALSERYGTLGRWEELFRATAAGLYGGSGWAVLALDLRTSELRTYWSGHHTQTVALGVPLLVLDMYEHSYHLDYGAAAAKYVDAFLRNVNWDEVSARYERATLDLDVEADGDVHEVGTAAAPVVRPKDGTSRPKVPDNRGFCRRARYGTPRFPEVPVPEIGHRRWAIAEGYIPGWSHGPEPAFTSHETLCVLNAGDRDARLEIVVYYEDREPVGPYRVTVPARRTLHLRFNALVDPEPIPTETPFASVISSDVPIVVQHTRLDSRQAENALMTTIAYPAG